MQNESEASRVIFRLKMIPGLFFCACEVFEERRTTSVYGVIKDKVYRVFRAEDMDT